MVYIYIYLNLEVIPKKFAFFKDVGVSSPVGWVTYDAGSQIPKLLLQLPNENEVGGGKGQANPLEISKFVSRYGFYDFTMTFPLIHYGFKIFG